MKTLKNIIGKIGDNGTICEVVLGYSAFVAAEITKNKGKSIFITADEKNQKNIIETLGHFYPKLKIMEFNGWDTVPYDRTSPKSDAMASRIEVMLNGNDADIIIATVGAVLQKLPPRQEFLKRSLIVKKNGTIAISELINFFNDNGYSKVEQVLEKGEYALRGGILDVYISSHEFPVRIDFFGDDIETIKNFDPFTQKSISEIKEFSVLPSSEVVLNKHTIETFRGNYRSLFGMASRGDTLYESIANGVRYNGMEQWLPLFYEELGTIFDYFPDHTIICDNDVATYRKDFTDHVNEYYNARVIATEKAFDNDIYNPVPPESLYIDEAAWFEIAKTRKLFDFYAYKIPADDMVSALGAVGEKFTNTNEDGYTKLANYIKSHDNVAVCFASNSAKARGEKIFKEKEINVKTIVLPLAYGFSAPDITLINEEDIFGEKLVKSAPKKVKQNFIADISMINVGDLVVHIDHGIGRYDGLFTIEAGGTAHDCLKVIYDGGDKLFVPVENIDVLSRYGNKDENIALNKLGSSNWQAKKAKLKQRIREIADELIKIAAIRHLKTAPAVNINEGLYDEFCARFPYVETTDQLNAINDVARDLAKGEPMDRLVCGDVGFGKTEVALRAGFMAVASGLQVAIVVPTTLLARQHYELFAKRFEGFGYKIAQLSRMVTKKNADDTKKRMESGEINLVVGTHALLAKDVKFANLGLIIIDEEQHFGVAHKEKLKTLKDNVHVLTLTATPIPRTLQMSLTGIRDLSLITTPPIDRLATKTFVSPYDSVITREALIREKNRGGQSFLVCPKISDIKTVKEKLDKLVPELKVVIAHGQMAPSTLEKIMLDFWDRKFDVLLSTTIIESGLDIPFVNTIIIYRADMFGLSQLYQLRGRVGRSKQLGYAYLMIPPNRVLSDNSQKRLAVMQSLDSLGSGFMIASHDMDIRGSGNLLGDEQSGHIKEVGVELYQSMLEEAVAAAKSGISHEEVIEKFSVQISLGLSVFIPEDYIKDLNLRLSLYQRIANAEAEELEDLQAEFIDRFGDIPEEVKNLFSIVELKSICRKCNIDRVEAGQGGVIIGFHKNTFKNPEKLIQFISRQLGSAKIRPDEKVVFIRNFETAEARVLGTQKIIQQLSELL